MHLLRNFQQGSLCTQSWVCVVNCNCTLVQCLLVVQLLQYSVQCTLLSEVKNSAVSAVLHKNKLNRYSRIVNLIAEKAYDEMMEMFF